MNNRNRPRSIRRSLTVVAVLILLVVSGCGGDDTSSTDPTSTDTTSTDTTSTDTTDTTDTTSAVAPTNAPGDPVGGSPACHDLFSDAEITELFGEPAVLETEDSMESIGQTVCSWATIDDADDDLASQVLTIQVYSGDPVPGGNFYDPSIYGDGEVREIDGIGDEAYVAGVAGLTTAFLDDDIAGFVSYAAVVFGDTDQVEPTEDQIVDILRRLHDRVT